MDDVQKPVNQSLPNTNGMIYIFYCNIKNSWLHEHSATATTEQAKGRQNVWQAKEKPTVL